MENKIRYTLKKEERLKSRKIIEQLFKEGRSFSLFPYRIIYLLRTLPADSHLQAGFSVSTRHFKKAVDRNRIKRLMREAYRLQKNELADQLKTANKKLALFFIYSGKEIPDYQKVSGKIQSSIKRLQKIVDEDVVANT